MDWIDRVYGQVCTDDSGVLEIIETSTFARLKGVRQAGPSALAFPFKDVTRHEHSLGVYALLRRLGASRLEQVAGLLHDVSHTAFSHAVDFVFASDEQDHHEHLKPLMLERPDLARAIAGMGFESSAFLDDSGYPMLEQPLPRLCADRLDYFLRDGMACGVVSPDFAADVLASLTVVEGRMALTRRDVATEAAARFATMNRIWWASATEGFIYNEFAQALREGFRLGVIDRDDLMTEDELVLAKLDAAGSPLIAARLASIREFRPECLANYRPLVRPKERWLDPDVVEDGHARPLSTLENRPS